MRAIILSAIVIFVSGLPALAYLEQFGPGDLVYEVVREVEERGCSASQKEWARLFEVNGGHISDFQANVTAMFKNGEISSPDGGVTLRLHRFGECD